MKLIDYFIEFAQALREQLKADELRWGDTWRNRSRVNQEHRIYGRIEDYFSQFVDHGTPMPWLKIAGLAFIGWVRERPDWVEPNTTPEEGAP